MGTFNGDPAEVLDALVISGGFPTARGRRPGR
jgi:hypothetical protein